MGRPALLRVLIGCLWGAGACSSASTPPDTAPPQWAWQAGWQAAERAADPSQSSFAGLDRVELRLPVDTPSGRAADVLLPALEAGVERFGLAAVDDELRWVGPPPPRSRDGAIAVIAVNDAGVRISAPGGAHFHTECDPCAGPDDWQFAQVPEVLTEAATDEVLVVFGSQVPWGATLSALDAAGSRPLRIARGE